MAVWSVSTVVALAGLGFLAWIVLKRPIIGIAFFLILFVFTTRMLSIGILDVFGPLYAVELFDEVGGTGAAFIYVLSIVAFLIPFFHVLERSRLRWSARNVSLTPPPSGLTIGDVVFATGLLFVLTLYADMLRIGVIPFFQEMERYEYNLQHAGLLHSILIEHGNLITLQLGIFCVFPRLRGGHTDLRIALVFLSLFPYLLLTSNRFSAFFAMSSTFALPFACILFLPDAELRRPWKMPSILGRLLRSRAAIAASLAAGIATVVFALWNSLSKVRGFESDFALLALLQRMFIQPGQMWVLTHQRVFVDGTYGPARAATFMFEDPIVPDRNTGIQYLMSEALDPQVAVATIEGGTTYAGGFPEVIFELFGPLLGWPVILLIGWLTARLLRTILLAIYGGRFLTAFWACYVFYALVVLLVGGMLNFLIASTFWIKVSLMVFFLAVERHRDGGSAPLIRWTLWRPAAASY